MKAFRVTAEKTQSDEPSVPAGATLASTRSLFMHCKTGWAQVNFAYANDVESTREKLRYDLYYIKNASLALDLVIVFMTAKKMLRFGGQ